MHDTTNPSRDAMQRYNNRARFYPKLATAITAADSSYKRKRINEAWLKAIAIQVSGGNQFYTCHCGDAQKSLEQIQTLLGISQERLKQAIQIQSNGHRFAIPRVTISPNYLGRINRDFGEFDPKVCFDIDILRRLHGGVFGAPLNGVLGWLPGKEETLQDFLGDLVLQVRYAAEELDAAMVLSNNDAMAAVKRYAICTDIASPEAFQFAVCGTYARLVKEGHTEEL